MKKKMALLIAVCLVALSLFPIRAFAMYMPFIIRIADSTGNPLINANVSIFPEASSDIVVYEGTTDEQGIVSFPEISLEDLRILITDSASLAVGSGEIALFPAKKTAITGYADNRYEINVNTNAGQLGMVIMVTSQGGIAIPTVADNAAPPSPTQVPTPTVAPTTNYHNIKGYLLNTNKEALGDYYITIDNDTTAHANADGGVFIPNVDKELHTLKVFNGDDELIGALNFQLSGANVTQLYGKDEEGAYQIKAKNGLSTIYMYITANTTDGTVAVTKASSQPLPPGTKPEIIEVTVTKPNTEGYCTFSGGEPMYPASITLTNADDLSTVSTQTTENGSYELPTLNMGENTLNVKQEEKLYSLKFTAQAADATGLSTNGGKPVINVKRGAAKLYFNFISDNKSSLMITGVADSPIDPPKYDKPMPTQEVLEETPKETFVLNGKLSDEMGRGIENAILTFSLDDKSPNATDVTDSQGIFVIPSLTFDSYNITITQTDGTKTTGEQAFAGGNKAGVWAQGSAVSIPTGAQSIYVTYKIIEGKAVATAAAQSGFVQEEFYYSADTTTIIIAIIVALTVIICALIIIKFKKKS